MNIYKVSRQDEISYDEYDSFVCAADSEDKARNMHPRADRNWDYEYDTWVSRADINTLYVELIGKADESLAPGVILASFNAG